MNTHNEPLTAYLDQNVFSRLRKGEAERSDLLYFLKKMSENNFVFVYSMVHIDECRASNRPEDFAEVMDELPAYFLEITKAADQKIVLSPDRARNLLLADFDIAEQAKRRIEDLLKPFHFASGWLGDVEANDLHQEMTRDMEAFWTSLEKDTDWTILDAEMGAMVVETLRLAKKEMSQLIENMPIQQLRNEAKTSFSKLRARLPTNLAQLDEIPADEVVSFVISRLEKNEKDAIVEQFPKSFWSNFEDRDEGVLAGFAFILFMSDVVRDRRVKTKSRKRREKHFLGQFRDCVHIENAARCDAFLTMDRPAARLARAVYSYAGVKTEAGHLRVEKS